MDMLDREALHIEMTEKFVFLSLMRKWKVHFYKWNLSEEIFAIKRFLWMINQSFVNLPFDKEKNNNIITWWHSFLVQYDSKWIDMVIE